LFDRAIEIRERLVNVEGRHELANDLALLYSNKAFAVENLGDNRSAVALYDRAVEVLERLVNVEDRRELIGEIAELRKSLTDEHKRNSAAPQPTPFPEQLIS
jgi:lipopolysaccharide biosynthesis regulator YciM